MLHQRCDQADHLREQRCVKDPDMTSCLPRAAENYPLVRSADSRSGTRRATPENADYLLSTAGRFRARDRLRFPVSILAQAPIIVISMMGARDTAASGMSVLPLAPGLDHRDDPGRLAVRCQGRAEAVFQACRAAAPAGRRLGRCAWGRHHAGKGESWCAWFGPANPRLRKGREGQRRQERRPPSDARSAARLE
jgi:hypothetical protein